MWRFLRKNTCKKPVLLLYHCKEEKNIIFSAVATDKMPISPFASHEYIAIFASSGWEVQIIEVK
jgi:hypothetical protein